MGCECQNPEEKSKEIKVEDKIITKFNEENQNNELLLSINSNTLPGNPNLKKKFIKAKLFTE